MIKLSEVYTEMGIPFDLPIRIKDKDGRELYCEYANGYRYLYTFDRGLVTSYEDNEGLWGRYKYDEAGNEIWHEESDSVVVTMIGKPIPA